MTTFRVKVLGNSLITCNLQCSHIIKLKESIRQEKHITWGWIRAEYRTWMDHHSHTQLLSNYRVEGNIRLDRCMKWAWVHVQSITFRMVLRFLIHFLHYRLNRHTILEIHKIHSWEMVHTLRSLRIWWSILRMVLLKLSIPQQTAHLNWTLLLQHFSTQQHPSAIP